MIYNRKKTPRSIFEFLIKLYYSEKIEELLSFFVWEIKYRLKLFGHRQKLKLDGHLGLYIKAGFDGLKTSDFAISKSKYNWVFFYLDGQGCCWGSTFEAKSTLINLSSGGVVQHRFAFENRIEGLYIDSHVNIFCCAGGTLYKKGALENDFVEVLKFSTPESRFRKEAFAEDGRGNLFVGEYANIFENKRWKFVGYVYYSFDSGDTWFRTDFLKKAGVNKHVHIIKWSRVVNGLVLTDGDNQKNIWINRSDSCFDKIAMDDTLGWKKLNKVHIQKGGYTAVVETRNEILFGTDYNGGTNFLVSTKDMERFSSQVVPNPYRRAVFDRIVLRKNRKEKIEMWCSIVFGNSNRVRSLLIMSNDMGRSWKKILEYDGTKMDLRIISMSNKLSDKVYFTLKSRNGEEATAMQIH